MRQSDFVKHTMDQSHYAGLWAFPANFSWSAWVVFFSMLEELLFEEIREKRGLTYGMRIQLERLHDISKVIVHGRISHEGATVMNDLVQSCIVQVPLSSELFVRKLTRAVRSESLVDLSGVGVVNHVAHNLIYDQRIITLQESFDSLKKVTFADMIRAAECLSVQRRYSVVAVP